jgi:hypothetical protein
MDSGLLAPHAPGMTSTMPNYAENARTERRLVRYGLSPAAAPVAPSSTKPIQLEENPMVITATELSPLVALIAGILILIIPRLLNFIVAIYLIFIGLVGLNNIHHWVNFH